MSSSNQATGLPMESQAPDLSGTVKRRHDLDALRAIAMLLGIVLHAALSFAPIPWTVTDTEQSTFFEIMFAAIHGFRMPLFFLISGFFTAMLWRKRGLGGLVSQRLKRILLPLVVGCFTIIPAMWGVSYLASQPTESANGSQIFSAVRTGDTAFVQQAINSGSVSVDEIHPETGSALLTIAAFYGQQETVELLLELGADVNHVNADSGTALHTSVFIGRVEAVESLIAAGASLSAKDNEGNTPKDNLMVDYGTTNFIAQMFGMTLDEETLRANRAEIAELLGENPEAVAEAMSRGPGVAALYGLLFQLPVFMHLWFLAFLCWLVVGFAAYTLVAGWIPFGRISRWLVCSPANLIWLVPLTMIPQHFMATGTFGPDASIGLFPIPSVLGYYAIFFFFGVIYWELDDQRMLGKWWRLTLPIAMLVVFPLGLELTTGALGFLNLDSITNLRVPLSNFFQAVFVWLMIYSSIGMFRAVFSTESPMMRYISDSSYWLYLAHLPLVILSQWLVRDLPVSAFVKFTAIVVVNSALLLLTYEYLIRYSFIGAILNGPKLRSAFESEARFKDSTATTN